MIDHSSLRYRTIETHMGCFAFVAQDEVLVATFLPAPVGMVCSLLDERYPDAREDRRLLPSFAKAVREYFAGRPACFDVRVHLDGVSPFYRKVYEQCRRIPFASTASYQDLARAAGNERAVRAVGSAMAANRLPLVVPCHRVLRSDGSIGGFSSPEGVEQKRRMLAIEGIDLRSGRIANARRNEATMAVD